MTPRFHLGFMLVILGGLSLASRDAQAVTILYTAEGDIVPTATDSFTGDGSQNGTMENDVSVNTDPAFGVNAFGFTAYVPASLEFDVIEMLPADSSLGTSFTLAAMAKTSSTTLMRLFSSWPSQGTSLAGDILFDFETDNGSLSGDLGLRLVVNSVTTSFALPGSATDGEYHHYAATYDNGAVSLYFDGDLLTSGTAGSGAVTLDEELWFGGDLGTAPSGAYTSQFVGSADDILVYNQALSQPQIAQIATVGAEAILVPEPSSWALLSLGLGLLVGCRVRRNA